MRGSNQWKDRVRGLAISLGKTTLVLATLMGGSGCAAHGQRTFNAAPSTRTMLAPNDSPSASKGVIRGDPLLASLQLGSVHGDCNVNGVADSLDISAAMDDDLNRNGILDICDPDSLMRHAADRWPGDTMDTTRVSLRVRHRDQGVYIQYIVPPGGAEVLLDVRRSNGTTLKIFHNGSHAAGVHQSLWDKTIASHDAADPGTYTFYLRVGTNTLQQRLRWEL